MRRFWRTGLAGLTLGISILIRGLYRGPYLSGWELIGPAQGLFLLSTKPLWKSIQQVFYDSRHFHTYWSSIDSAVYTLIPGLLTRLTPWPYWGPLLSLTLFLTSAVVLLRAAGIPGRESWMLWLMLGASPALLSFSLNGFPYAAQFLPQALALGLIASPQFRESWMWSLIGTLAITELSWHLYPLSRTVYVVFLAGALFHREVPWKTKAVWVLVPLFQIWQIGRFRDVGTNMMLSTSVANLPLSEIWKRLLSLGDKLFVAQTLDLPVLWLCGAASLFFYRKNRWLNAALMVFYLAFVIRLALVDPYGTHSRRFLSVDWGAIVCLLGFFQSGEGAARVKKGLVAILIFGTLWQGQNLLAYIQTPVRERRYALPFAYSPSDYRVKAAVVESAKVLLQEIRQGRKIILVYNLFAPPENTTDPAGLIERLYLSLGHERFVDSVLVFGSIQSRYNVLPIHPLEDVPQALDRIAADPNTLPQWSVWTLSNKNQPQRFQVESDRIMMEVRKRFETKENSPQEGLLYRLTGLVLKQKHRARGSEPS